MKKFIDPACPSCGHSGTGTEEVGLDLMARRTYDPPPADCDCGCHGAWRMVNGVPATATEAAA